jgi:hypothetical protein
MFAACFVPSHWRIDGYFHRPFCPASERRHALRFTSLFEQPMLTLNGSIQALDGAVSYCGSVAGATLRLTPISHYSASSFSPLPTLCAASSCPPLTTYKPTLFCHSPTEIAIHTYVLNHIF